MASDDRSTWDILSDVQGFHSGESAAIESVAFALCEIADVLKATVELKAIELDALELKKLAREMTGQ